MLTVNQTRDASFPLTVKDAQPGRVYKNAHGLLLLAISRPAGTSFVNLSDTTPSLWCPLQLDSRCLREVQATLTVNT